MRVRVGEVSELFRYPVKSMRGEALENAGVGWHGLEGDRRLGLRRVHDQAGFPWLTASKLPELLLFTPHGDKTRADAALPTHVRTPEGQNMALFGQELAEDISRRHGSPVEMVHLNRGIFDEASVSLISASTVAAVSRSASLPSDVRRFRPNVVIATPGPDAFAEDAWVGGVLSFGEGDDAAAIFVTNWDVRCSMVNYDPDTARPDPGLLKAIVRDRDNKAGVYGAVVRPGSIAVGQPVMFEATGSR